MSTVKQGPKVAITGASGFIGQNLVWALRQRGINEIEAIHRNDGDEAICRKISGARVVFHLAGVNRPKDEAEFVTGNVDNTQRLISALEELGQQPVVVFASSTQASLNTAYGRSKAQAEELLEDFGQRSRAPIRLLRLPNIFGKWCRPNYNSVVATFCYNIANDREVHINDSDHALELMYVDDLVEFLVDHVTRDVNTISIDDVPVFRVTVGQLATLIRSYREDLSSVKLPDAATGIGRALYATFISSLPREKFARRLAVHRDSRGEFAELCHTQSNGQMSYFTAEPGVVRGDHYHHSKVERFFVISGSALFKYRHIQTGELYEVRVNGGAGDVVESIPGWTHSVKNVGESVLIVALWANEIFDPAKPDTFANKVDA